MKIPIAFLTGIFLLSVPLAGCTALPTVGASLPQPTITPQTTIIAAVESPAPLLTVTPALAVTLTVTLTSLALPSDTGMSADGCDHVAPGQPMDVTISDGSHFAPGESFSKTWRLVNAGSCAWDEEYSVVWFSGQRFGPVVEQRLAGVVQSGSVIEITVDMIAPDAPGVYQSNWKMRSADGELFGLGPDGDAPFWVKIEVLPRSTDTPSPQTTSVTTLPVFSSATASLLLNQRLDLDSGQIDPESGDDLVYGFDTLGQLALLPQNGARAGLFSAQLPTEGECQSIFLSSDAVALVTPLEGQYLCYRTGQGLPGYLRLAEEQTDSALALDFVTWLVP